LSAERQDVLVNLQRVEEVPGFVAPDEGEQLATIP
jgi:hypothetical protein